MIRLANSRVSNRRGARRIHRTRSAVAALGLTFGLIASVFLAWSRPAASQAAFPQPDVLQSANGVLRTTLTAAEKDIELDGKRLRAKTFNDAYVGPTLKAAPGERIEFNLVNQLSEPTNLHFHGLHVSPDGESDNIFRQVLPGETAQYVIDLPKDQPPGTFWYHSHQHGISEEQVFTGLSGVIVVDGTRQLLPADLQGIEERVIALKDFQVKDNAIVSQNIDSNAPTTRTVNGHVDPKMTIAPGESQLWRFANIGADIWYRVALDGHPFLVVGEDGNPVWNTRGANALILPPGKRFEVLVQGGQAGTYALKTLPYDQGGDQYPETKLATLTVEGTAQTAAAMPTTLAPNGDLSNAELADRRDIFFSEFDDSNQFFINGKQFDHHRVDEQVKLGTIEEWTIHNATAEQHPFHIHVNDFQVMSVNGVPYDAGGLQDTVILPAGGTVVIRTAFTDFTGKFVFHCHILNHEDNGMMAVVEVVA